MKVAAVATVLNEADIIGSTLAHLYEQGVANVYIADGMSSDGTRDVLSRFPCKVFDDNEPCHRQPYWTGLLAQHAYEDGADFVIPFDADEYVIAPGSTIAAALAKVPSGVGKLYMQMWHHYTWELKEAEPKRFPKVAFRAQPNVVLANGNHEATVEGDSLHGILEIRELQYRSEDHFVRKVRERNATLDPALPAGEGGHHMRFKDYTDDEIRAWWRADNPFWGNARHPIHDPIPSRFRCA